MALVKWDPFKDLLSIQERMNRMIDDTLAKRREKSGVSLAAWSPAVDIVEHDDEIILTVELPGVSKEDIQLEVKENMLTISGERKFEKEYKEEDYHRIERSYGKFHRSFTLPSEIKPDEVKASYKDGLLCVTLPKAIETECKKIEIED